MQIDLKKIFGDTGSLEEKFVKTILKAFKNHSKDGFDYLKFKKSVASLKELDVEESIQLKSAFATAQTMGVSKIKLEQSIQEYMRILDKEQNEFSEALKKQIDQKVNGELERVEKYKTEASLINAKIEKLKKNQQEYLSAAKSLSIQINKAKQKIEKTRNQFVETYDYFKKEMNQDLENIQNQL